MQFPDLLIWSEYKTNLHNSCIITWRSLYHFEKFWKSDFSWRYVHFCGCLLINKWHQINWANARSNNLDVSIVGLVRNSLTYSISIRTSPLSELIGNSTLLTSYDRKINLTIGISCKFNSKHASLSWSMTDPTFDNFALLYTKVDLCGFSSRNSIFYFLP